MIALLLLIAAGPATQPFKYEGGKPGQATVTGHISLAHMVPPTKVTVTKDGDKCGREKADESYVYAPDLSLKNVVVWIDGIQKGKDLQRMNVVLENITCLYVPHVAIATVGSTLEIKNMDGVQHNTHGYLVSPTFGFLGAGLAAVDGRPSIFNVSLPVKGLSVKRKLDQVGVIDVRNDAGHPWMRAWLLVFDHPYMSVSDESGRFSIEKVPQGSYTLHAWHEAAGERHADIEVTAAGTTVSDFIF